MKLSSPDIAPVGLTRKKRKMNLMMCPIASWVITMVYRTGFVLTTGRSKRSRRLISRFVDTQITNLVMKRLLLA
ncbi:Uncharacterised protein [Vibrio cholerae]|nr:Uncharacterised protein [Vibrio cholerae]